MALLLSQYESFCGINLCRFGGLAVPLMADTDGKGRFKSHVNKFVLLQSQKAFIIYRYQLYLIDYLYTRLIKFRFGHNPAPIFAL